MPCYSARPLVHCRAGALAPAGPRTADRGPRSCVSPLAIECAHSASGRRSRGTMLQSVALRGVVLAGVLLIPLRVAAQGTIADYQRAVSLRERYQNLAY